MPNDAGTDLYSYDVASGVLTDLTVDNEPADAAAGADVEEVLGASRNGDYLYFVARGKLAAGGTSGERNLYVEHDGAIDFIATDPELGAHFYVTPDGLHAAFTTSAQHGGYDNAGYRRGLSLQPTARDRVRLLPARRRTADRRLPRSPAGRSPTTARASSSRAPTRSCRPPRAPRPTSSSTSAATVHLLTPGEGDPAILLGASASGDDVFIASFEELSPQGQGKVFAIYDARVNAVVPRTRRKQFVCQNEGCRGPSSVAAPEVALRLGQLRSAGEDLRAAGKVRRRLEDPAAGDRPERRER